ncbi:leucine-rich repeat-containing protein 74A-like isoform X2 [Anthonomus grandis grandis]|uniref:leucine-rich repeat-containing protein 74A-like isoform X2 n=1 Tax=Anthonomus grandis grandis TaxID=2921223 RepID=UPI0021653BBD|nr:leucine-rich repeat-containing protein 74A-like isoform X2 [Anthonomus grandis grandis]
MDYDSSLRPSYTPDVPSEEGSLGMTAASDMRVAQSALWLLPNLQETTAKEAPVPMKKSTMTAKLEDKFKRYVSQGDLLLRALSTVSEEIPFIEDLCDSQHLLERNTKSFQCLAQLLLSSSSLTKNRLFLFPPLEDPGIDLAFNFEEPPPVSDEIGIEKYKKICHELDIVPISRIIDSLDTNTLDLKYYGLTDKQIRALSEAMKVNMHVQELILTDNWLSVEMTETLSDMLIENMALQYLSLYECRIGEEGAKKLGYVLSGLQTLKQLDLSFNELGDNGLLALRDGLCENTSLKTLNLSHNNISENSAETMEKILLENKCLEELDLSWNGFFTAPGNKRLFSGFLNSDRIKKLNLAWNGIGVILAVKPLSRYITKSQRLEELDLSNNRLIGKSLRSIRTAVNKNHSLQILHIGNNIYAPEEAHFLLTMLAGKTKDPLYYVNMDNMYVKKESKGVLNKINNVGKIVKIGGILSNYEIHGPDTKKLIYERCRYLLMKPKKAKARKDFGHFILSLPDHPITPEEFEKELKKAKIKKLDKDLVQSVKTLFTTRKKEIDCVELVRNYMSYYPDTQLPPPKPKKKKGGKKGKKGKAKVTEVEQEIKVHELENGADGVEATEPRKSRVSENLAAETLATASKRSIKSATEEGRQSINMPEEKLQSRVSIKEQ